MASSGSGGRVMACVDLASPNSKTMASAPQQTHRTARELHARAAHQLRHLRASTCIVATTIGTYAMQALTSPSLRTAIWDVSSSPVTQLLCKSNKAILRNGQWHRVVTCAFVHTSLPHVLMNVYGMLRLCPYMERRHGTPTMALTYVATGAAATLASVCFSRAPAAGASGALFGLLGMECASEALAARRHGAGHEHAEHAMAIARVTGFALALGLVIPGLDNAGHVGGTVSGALCGWVADATAQRTAPRKLS